MVRRHRPSQGVRNRFPRGVDAHVEQHEFGGIGPPPPKIASRIALPLCSSRSSSQDKSIRRGENERCLWGWVLGYLLISCENDLLGIVLVY